MPSAGSLPWRNDQLLLMLLVLACSMDGHRSDAPGQLHVMPPSTFSDQGLSPSAWVPSGEAGVLWRAGHTLCTVDDYGRYPAMMNLLSQATQMLKTYNNKLAQHRQFSFCRRFEPLLSGIQDVRSACPTSAFHLEGHWTPVINHITCVCNTPGESCTEDRECTEREFRGQLVEHCDKMYAFNVMQRTKEKCFFTRENLDCKLSLVSSACGEKAAEFVFHALSILLQDHASTSRCVLQRNDAYTGFRYHADCPNYFLHDMRSCEIDSLKGRLLKFEQEFDLVVQDSPRELHQACRYYREYVLCMRDKKRACPEGDQLMHDANPSSRIYLLKMNFICQRDVRKEYQERLTCYQEALHNNTHNQCSYTWRELNPHLRRVSAVDFYCKKHSEWTLNVLTQLDRVRACHVRIFNGRCGHPSGDLMGKFMERIFQDPEYLRLGFKPDCKLHKNNHRYSNMLPTVTPSSHHRHSHNTTRSHPTAGSLHDSQEVVKDTSCSGAGSCNCVYPLSMLIVWSFMSSVT